MNIDKQIRQWAQLINENDRYLMDVYDRMDPDGQDDDEDFDNHENDTVNGLVRIYGGSLKRIQNNLLTRLRKYWNDAKMEQDKVKRNRMFVDMLISAYDEIIIPEIDANERLVEMVDKIRKSRNWNDNDVEFDTLQHIFRCLSGRDDTCDTEEKKIRQIMPFVNVDVAVSENPDIFVRTSCLLRQSKKPPT